MNLAVVPIAEELANNNVMIVEVSPADLEKIVKCLVLFVQNVVKKLLYLLSLLVTDLCIAEIVSNLKGHAVTDNKDIKRLLTTTAFFLWAKLRDKAWWAKPTVI